MELALKVQEVARTVAAGESSLVTSGVVVCFLIGLLEGLSVLWMAVMGVYRNYLRPEINFKKYGAWGVVTGATDGIGKAYCKELAKRGLNIFMLSRTESKLKDLGEDLKSKYGVDTAYLAVDFSQVPKKTWKVIEQKIEHLDISILVNNVGASYEHYEFLEYVDDETVDDLIEINVRATTEMTRIVLLGMAKRKRGIVVSLGSGVGSVMPASPLLAVYAGTKAYIEQFTKCLDVEYRPEGILFQDQAPLFVATKMTKISKPSLTIPSADTWVAGAIRQIGYEPLTTGYAVHNIIWGLLKGIPGPVLQNFFLSSAKHLRARALRKKKQNK